MKTIIIFLLLIVLSIESRFLEDEPEIIPCSLNSDCPSPFVCIEVDGFKKCQMSFILLGTKPETEPK